MDFKAHSLEFLEHSLLLRGKKKKKNILACAIFVILISKNSWSCAAQTVVFSTHCSDFFSPSSVKLQATASPLPTQISLNTCIHNLKYHLHLPWREEGSSLSFPVLCKGTSNELSRRWTKVTCKVLTTRRPLRSPALDSVSELQPPSRVYVVSFLLLIPLRIGIASWSLFLQNERLKNWIIKPYSQFGIYQMRVTANDHWS